MDGNIIQTCKFVLSHRGVGVSTLQDLTDLGFKISGFNPLTVEGSNIAPIQIKRLAVLLEQWIGHEEDAKFEITSRPNSISETCYDTSQVHDKTAAPKNKQTNLSKPEHVLVTSVEGKPMGTNHVQDQCSAIMESEQDGSVLGMNTNSFDAHIVNDIDSRHEDRDDTTNLDARHTKMISTKRDVQECNVSEPAEVVAKRCQDERESKTGEITSQANIVQPSQLQRNDSSENYENNTNPGPNLHEIKENTPTEIKMFPMTMDRYKLALEYFHKPDIVHALKSAEEDNDGKRMMIPVPAGSEEIQAQFQSFRKKKLSLKCNVTKEILQSVQSKHHVRIIQGDANNELVLGGTDGNINAAKLTLLSQFGEHNDLTLKINAKETSSAANMNTKTIEMKWNNSTSDLQHYDSTQRDLSTKRFRETHTGGARPKELSSSVKDQRNKDTQFQIEYKERSSSNRYQSPPSEFYSRNKKFKVTIRNADITKLRVDCIVNAANRHLRHAGGVARAISEAAGKDLVDDCKGHTLFGKTVDVTGVFVSRGGHLPAKHVLHAVGPKWDSYDDKDKCASDLKHTVLRCLLEAARMNKTSIAIPSISAAIFKVPQPICAKSYMKASRIFIEIFPKLQPVFFPKIDLDQFEIQFVDIDDTMLMEIKRCFENHWDERLSYSEEHNAMEFANVYLQEKLDDHGVKKTEETSDTPHNKWRSSYNRPRQSERTQTHAAGTQQYDYEIDQTTVSIRNCHATDIKTNVIVLIGHMFNEISGLKGFNVRISSQSENITTDDSYIEIRSLKKPGNEHSTKTMCCLQQDLQKLKNGEKQLIDRIKKALSLVELKCHRRSEVEHVVFTSPSFYPGKSTDPKTVGTLSRIIFDFVKQMSQDKDGCSPSHVTVATSADSKPTIEKIFDTRVNVPDVRKIPRREITKNGSSHVSSTESSARRADYGRNEQSSSGSKVYRPNTSLWLLGAKPDSSSTEKRENEEITKSGTSHVSSTESSARRADYGRNEQSSSGSKVYRPNTSLGLLGAKPDSSSTEKRENEENVQKQEQKECPICYEFTVVEHVKCCGKVVCPSCLGRCQRCPFCQTIFGILRGNQPFGTMTCRHSRPIYGSVPGYEGFGIFTITYNFPSGTQGEEHDTPGRYYSGCTRTAYLPATDKGMMVLQLLRLAFIRRLIFTIGTSATLGQSDRIVWSIHHKSSLNQGLHGYPDPTYLDRVLLELAERGVFMNTMNAYEIRDVNSFMYLL